MLSFVFLFSDILGSTAFAPVKLDISGNIKVRHVFVVAKSFYFYYHNTSFSKHTFSVSTIVQFQRQYTFQIIL